MSKLSSFNNDLILVEILPQDEKIRSDSTLAGEIEFKSLLHLSKFGHAFTQFRNLSAPFLEY